MDNLKTAKEMADVLTNVIMNAIEESNRNAMAPAGAAVVGAMRESIAYALDRLVVMAKQESVREQMNRTLADMHRVEAIWKR